MTESPSPRDAVLLSGGVDSTTLLAHRVARGTAVLTVSVDYGQRHKRELDAAAEISRHYGLANVVLDLSAWGRELIGSALTDSEVEVPHGHYTAETMKSTVVPNRNATLLMAAAGVALTRGADQLCTAVHSGDHAIYPDCRPGFLDHIDSACLFATDGAMRISAPFVDSTKTDIVRLGAELDAPLGLTWSCYEGGARHCGLCGTCVERREAFELAEVDDPTDYAAQVTAA